MVATIQQPDKLKFEKEILLILRNWQDLSFSRRRLQKWIHQKVDTRMHEIFDIFVFFSGFGHILNKYALKIKKQRLGKMLKPMVVWQK